MGSERQYLKENHIPQVCLSCVLNLRVMNNLKSISPITFWEWYLDPWEQFYRIGSHLVNENQTRKRVLDQLVTLWTMQAGFVTKVLERIVSWLCLFCWDFQLWMWLWTLWLEALLPFCTIWLLVYMLMQWSGVCQHFSHHKTFLSWFEVIRMHKKTFVIEKRWRQRIFHMKKTSSMR